MSHHFTKVGIGSIEVGEDFGRSTEVSNTGTSHWAWESNRTISRKIGVSPFNWMVKEKTDTARF